MTIIMRWDLKDSPSTLHPSFDQLGVRRASVSSPSVTELDLQRLEDTVLEKCVIAVSPVIMGTVISLACGDGTFEFRDRLRLQPFSSKSLDVRITNMMQAGFSFPPGEPCIDMVLSPNNTVAVRLAPNNEVHMMVMEYTRGSMDVPENVDITCVALALQHAYSCSNYLNNDDLLLVARKYGNLGNALALNI
jgi:mediator of RNA polymerase II transcription subunit 16